jgi:type IV pilus assembly protein PilM
MRKFKKTCLGLDIGTRFIKFVELKKTADAVVLNKFGIKEIPVNSKTDRDKTVIQLITQLFSENKITARNVNICAGGQSVFVRFVKLLQAKEDKLTQTMRFEAQNQIPFPLNEVVWDWSLLDKNKDNPRRAVIVAIKKNLIEDMVSNLKNLKLAVDLVDVAPVSLYNCMVFNEEYNDERLGAVLDIGAKTSNLVIFRKGNIWIRTFPVAADRIKEAKEQGMEELAGEIGRSIEYYFMQNGEEARKEKKIEELILTGGGSGIDDIISVLADKFDVKPKVLDPFKNMRISKDAFAAIKNKEVRNQLAVASGLALRGVSELKIEVNFLKEILLKKYLASQKMLYSRLSIAAAALILICFFVFMRQNYFVKRVKLDKIDEMLEVYRTYEPKIKELQEEEDVLKGKIEILYQTSASRDIWLSVFKNISRILPKDVWITDTSGIVSLEKSGLGRLDLSGKALSYQSVNGFVSALKSSPGFKDVKPISSSIENDQNTGEEIVKFSITMDVVMTEE